MTNYQILDVYLKHIHYFLAVAETGNVTQAAKNLYITQPLLSKKLMALEEQIGMRLFIHEGRRVHLTKAGHYLYKEWKLLLENYDRSIEHARQISLEPLQKLNIGCFPVLQANSFILPYVKQFCSFEPQMEIQISRKNYNSLLEELILGKQDLIFLPEDDLPGIQTDLEWTPVESFPYVAVIPENNLLYTKEYLDFEDLNHQNIYYADPRGMLSRISRFQHQCKLHNVNPYLIHFVNNDLTSFLNAELGLGIAVGLRMLFPEKGNQVKIINIRGTEVQIVALWSKNAAKSLKKLFYEVFDC